MSTLATDRIESDVALWFTGLERAARDFAQRLCESARRTSIAAAYLDEVAIEERDRDVDV